MTAEFLKRESEDMTKKIMTAVLAFAAALAVFAVMWFRDDIGSKADSQPGYSLSADNYEADDWYEKEERDGYTITKHYTMGSPSIMVEYMYENCPVSVTITRGSKTTLVYSPDYSSYDMYLEYRNDLYVIEDDFANLEEIVPLAYDWSQSTYTGTYSEDEEGAMHTDEDGNTYYYDEAGNKVIYQYSDEF